MRKLLTLAAILLTCSAYGQGIWSKSTTNSIWNRTKTDSVQIVPRDTLPTNNALYNGAPVGDSGRIAWIGGFLWVKGGSGPWKKVGDIPDLTPYVKYADTAAMLTPYLRKSDTVYLSNRINGKLNITPLIGSLYGQSTWASLSDFTTNGSVTTSITSGKIDISTAIESTVDNSFDLNTTQISNNGNTCLEYWRQTLRYKVSTAQSSVSHGLAIGIRSINSHVNSSVAAYVDLSSGYPNSGKVHIVSTYPINFEVLNTSTQIFSYSIDDYIELIFERNANIFNVSARNVTANSPAIITSFTFSTESTTHNLPNTGRFSVFALGGNYQIDSFSVFSKEVSGSDIMAIGDSKTVGYVANIFNTFPNLLRTVYGSIVTHAGGGDRSDEVLERIPEIVSLTPRKAVIEIGTNDDVDSVTFKTNYPKIIDSLIAHGIDVYHMTFYQPGNAWRNNYIIRTFPADKIIETYIPTSEPGALGYDGVHLSNYGDSLVFNAIVSSGRFLDGGISQTPSHITGVPNYTPVFTSTNSVGQGLLYQFGRNLGFGTTVPSAPTGFRVLHIHDSTASSSPGIHLTNNGTGGTVGDGTMIFLGNGGSTGEGSLGFYNQEAAPIVFYTSSSEKARISATGDLGVGSISPSSKVDITGVNGYTQFRLRTQYTPTSSADSNGSVGDISVDDNYIYFKTSTGWKRSALTSF